MQWNSPDLFYAATSEDNGDDDFDDVVFVKMVSIQNMKAVFFW